MTPDSQPEPLNSLPGREKDSMDAVIEVYKRDVDRTLLRENLKLTVEQRLRKLQDFVRFLEEMRKAGARSRELESLREERRK